MKLRKRTIVAFLAPAMIAYVMIFLYPVFRTAAMSFFDTKSISSRIADWTFVGGNNFIELFQRRTFVQSMVNIAKIWLFSGIAVFLISMFFAVSLTSGIKGKNVFRTIIYLPEVISGLALSYMWQLYVFNGNFGMLKTFFKSMGWTGLARFGWLSPNNMFLSMSIAYVFGSVGYFMMTYMAAIEGIPVDYYEAANIEGASRFRSFISITLPLIRDTIISTITLWTTRVIGFYTMSVVFSSSNTVTPMYFIYQTLFGSEESSASISVGISSAGAVVMTLCIVIVFVIANRLNAEPYEY